MSGLDGAFLCTRGSKPPTPEDLAIVAEFARRLAGGTTPKENTMQGDIYVAQGEDGDWFVGIEGRYDTQAEAIEQARPLAKQLHKELTIHGEDGQIREKDSHGNDPKEIKG